jgi:hypothetical protein
MNRPAFIPPADWPTNGEIVAKAMCRADPFGCPCQTGGTCLAPMMARQAAGVVDALARHHRLVSPTLERGRG